MNDSRNLEQAFPACTLHSAEAIRQRIAEWRGVLDHAADRQPIDGGMALRFAPDGEVAAALGRLAVAEQGCCGFFSFDLHVDGDGVRFEVRAPEAAQEELAEIFAA